MTAKKIQVKKIVKKVLLKKKALPKKKVVAKKKADLSSSDVSFTISDSTLTVTYPIGDKFETKSFDKGSKEYFEIKKAIKEGRFSDVPKLATQLISEINEYAGKFKEKFLKVVNGSVTIDGKEVPIELSTRILTYAREGLPYMDLVNFFRNLQKNPSMRAVQGLFQFLDNHHFPLTNDGCFIAYKGIRADFKDLHSNTFDNSVGKVVKMPRNAVDENPENGCSAGLHIASYSYSKQYYGGQVHVQVKVNPKDVVAVPKDDNFEKMRTCEYKVLAVSTHEIQEQRVDDGDTYHFHAPVDARYGGDDSDDNDDDNDDENPDW